MGPKRAYTITNAVRVSGRVSAHGAGVTAEANSRVSPTYISRGHSTSTLTLFGINNSFGARTGTARVRVGGRTGMVQA